MLRIAIYGFFIRIMIEEYAMQDALKRDVFDFEIGYLTKSPCIKCENKSCRPKCHKDCLILDRLQTLLARGISTQAAAYES